MPQHPLFNVGCELIDLTNEAEDNDGYVYCLVGIDRVAKYAWGVPIKTKTARLW